MGKKLSKQFEGKFAAPAATPHVLRPGPHCSDLQRVFNPLLVDPESKKLDLCADCRSALAKSVAEARRIEAGFRPAPRGAR